MTASLPIVERRTNISVALWVQRPNGGLASTLAYQDVIHVPSRRRRFAMRFPGLATLGVVALCACGGGGGGGGPQAASVALSAGDNQVAPAGTALAEALAVIVRDNAGAALPGALVTWSVTTGAGWLAPPTPPTRAGGSGDTAPMARPAAAPQTASATGFP